MPTSNLTINDAIALPQAKMFAPGVPRFDESLRRGDKATEGLAVCETVLDESVHPLQDFHDHRFVVRTIAATQAEKGRCEFELKEYDRAEASLSEAMTHTRRCSCSMAHLKSFRSPI